MWYWTISVNEFWDGKIIKLLYFVRMVFENMFLNQGDIFSWYFFSTDLKKKIYHQGFFKKYYFLSWKWELNNILGFQGLYVTKSFIHCPSTRKHVFKISSKFWSESFRNIKKSWKHASTIQHAYLCVYHVQIFNRTKVCYPLTEELTLKIKTICKETFFKTF